MIHKPPNEAPPGWNQGGANIVSKHDATKVLCNAQSTHPGT